MSLNLSDHFNANFASNQIPTRFLLLKTINFNALSTTTHPKRLGFFIIISTTIPLRSINCLSYISILLLMALHSTALCFNGVSSNHPTSLSHQFSGSSTFRRCGVKISAFSSPITTSPSRFQLREQILVNDSSRVKEYLPIVGLADFNKLSAKLIFGADSPAIQENRVTTVQCLSGPGSLRVGAEFLAKHYHQRTIYIPQPTWGNHPKIFTIGGLSVKTYSYYDPATRGLNFQGLLDDLSSAPSGAIVLLHACAHNPTGVDPTLEQWEQIRKLMRSKGLLPFFDSAYQGFASGSLDADAQSVRMFVADGGECLVAQSYAKNMGLYGERVGALSIVCKNADVASRVESQLKLRKAFPSDDGVSRTNESSLVVCFGEMLIDFVPTTSGLSLADAPAFKKAPGGAPANVAVGIARLGGSSAFIGKVGEDEFGYMLADILKENNVNNEGMRFDPGARTALAFVTLRNDGEREFMFYRNPSADMLLQETELDYDLIRKEPCKSAHIAAAKAAKDAGVILSYDPNLRLPLWSSAESAREGILSIWEIADIIKISEEEISFLTQGEDPYDDAVVRKLFHPNLTLLLVTEGPDGCRYYTKEFSGRVKGLKVDAVDTTGAGDAFVAGILSQLAADVSLLQEENRLKEALRFANACGALTVQERGAIPALPTREAVLNALLKTVA
ncbi:unnamed protein product [Camellia sinensis]